MNTKDIKVYVYGPDGESIILKKDFDINEAPDVLEDIFKDSIPICKFILRINKITELFVGSWDRDPNRNWRNSNGRVGRSTLVAFLGWEKYLGTPEQKGIVELIVDVLGDKCVYNPELEMVSLPRQIEFRTDARTFVNMIQTDNHRNALMKKGIII